VSIALYRRFRPEAFNEVIGQEQVTVPLMAALRAGKVNHAYLFSGPRGCGKTTSARILARTLNCAANTEAHPLDTPCGECESCVELSRLGAGSLDVVEIDAASHGGVDAARDLRERAAFTPSRDRFKIFIIDEAHMVTKEGFNALLKVVEEPPPHIKFIFATTEPDKVLGTIRSRTHHYPFRLVPAEVLGPYLENIAGLEGASLGPGVVPLVTRAGGGSVRDSLSVLDQLIAGSVDGAVTYDGAVALLGYTPVAMLDDAVAALANQDGAALFQVIDRVIDNGNPPQRFAEDLLQRIRDLIVVSVMGELAATVFRDWSPDQLESARAQAAGFDLGTLTRLGETISAGLGAMVGATSPRLQLELLCARLLIPIGAEQLAARLTNLEQSFATGSFPIVSAPSEQSSSPVGRVAVPRRIEATGTPLPDANLSPRARSAARLDPAGSTVQPNPNDTLRESSGAQELSSEQHTGRLSSEQSERLSKPPAIGANLSPRERSATRLDPAVPTVQPNPSNSLGESSGDSAGSSASVAGFDSRYAAQPATAATGQLTSPVGRVAASRRIETTGTTDEPPSDQTGLLYPNDSLRESSGTPELRSEQHAGRLSSERSERPSKPPAEPGAPAPAPAKPVVLTPAAAAPEPANDNELEQLKSSWPELVANIPSPVTRSIAQASFGPVAVSADQVVIGFDHQTMVGRLAEPRHANALGQLVSERLGRQVSVVGTANRGESGSPATGGQSGSVGRGSGVRGQSESPVGRLGGNGFDQPKAPQPLHTEPVAQVRQATPGRQQNQERPVSPPPSQKAQVDESWREQDAAWLAGEAIPLAVPAADPVTQSTQPRPASSSTLAGRDATGGVSPGAAQPAAATQAPAAALAEPPAHDHGEPAESPAPPAVAQPAAAASSMNRPPKRTAATEDEADPDDAVAEQGFMSGIPLILEMLGGEIISEEVI